MNQPEFIKKDSFSNGFESIIANGILKKSKPNLVTSFSPSTITECPRKLNYQSMETRSDKLLDYLSTSSDVYGKSKWIDYFTKFQGVKLIEKNLTAADCNCNISGILDAVLEIDDIITATQIFFVESDAFAEIKSGGAFKKHIIETMIYMWLVEVKDGLLIYENKNTNEFLSFHIEPYQPVITSVQKKCLLLMDNKIRGLTPEKPYKTMDSSECKKCEYLKLCWNS